MLSMSVPPASLPSPARDVSLRGLLRQLAAILPEGGVTGVVGGGVPIEVFSTADDLPRLVSAKLLEAGDFRAHRVPPGESVPFAAFLDGKQQSHVLQFVARGAPIIYGTVGAAIRVRHDRRMTTWRHEVTSRLYAPARLVPSHWNDALAQLGVAVIDTSAPGDGQAELVQHPFALSDAAIHRVQADREATELRLAEQWCETVAQPLFVDGGISASERLATSDCVVGVVKNHRTLYVEDAGLEVVFGLRAGERTSVFQVTSRKRTTVASWYLRLRDAAGHDPMWGLVRVEIPYSQLDTKALAGRAEEASRRILAEVAPVALPDARWDRMVYGIRDCEEFLRSVM
jgi:hypothetical protein